MVTLELDGKYHALVRGQDTERASFDTKEEAFSWYKNMYRFMNGFMKESEHVEDPVFIDRTKWPVVSVRVKKDHYDFTISNDLMHQAIDIGARRARFEDGHLYEIRVIFKEVEGSPPFIAEGI